MAKKKKKSKKKTKKKAKRKPRTHGSSGRNSKGQFKKGNQCSVGNASSGDSRAKWLKKALYNAITDKDITAIVKKLASEAKKGDVPAAKELFDRLWGRAKQEVDLGANEDLQTFIDWLVGRDGNSENTG